ncbi:MAG TPA: hypothetical protein VGL39_27550 [Jatrophihabitantaceae bacterium]|jgi:hypothetical protein
MTAKTCRKCQQVHERCTAHNRRGGPCGGHPSAGFRVCRLHGAESPNAKAGAEKRLAEAQAVALAARWAIPVDANPVETILDQIKWSAGHVAFYRTQVDALNTKDMVWGQTKEKQGGEDWGATYEAQQSAWLVLYNQERERLVKFCSEAIRAGIEERRVRLAEQQGALVAEAIRAILGELHLTAEQQALVPEVVPRHLRLLAGGAQ